MVIGSIDPTTIATFSLAFVTLCLVAVTLGQLRLTRRALELSIQPLLAETPPPPPGAEPTDSAQFGAPGRIFQALLPGQFWYQQAAGSFYLSIAFRNVGAGIAAITGAETDPPSNGSVVESRAYVPVGEHVRVNVSRMVSKDGDRFAAQGWAMDGFAITIYYSDTQGKRRLVSRAMIKQYATHGPYIDTIEVARQGRFRRHTIVVGRMTA